MKKIFITGGAGFIGSNLAKFHLNKGDDVYIYDNLSRKGTEKNLKWLRGLNKNIKFINGDIRNFDKLAKYISKSDVIYHMAGQVAVTTSIANPREDFEINALGTLNVLEAFRKYSPKGVLVYASTNKVYGNFDHKNFPKNGIDENQNLDFHSPYGCSKGAGDQYVRDYGRVYNLKTIVFRQSCIYGDRQLGTEDQGWVMHFAKSVNTNQKITIYGDGKQIRDILYITDLINAYQLAIKKIKFGEPEIYNIGGGTSNSISLLSLIKIVEEKTGKKSKLKFEKSREGDQQIYISNINKVNKHLGWKPEVDIEEGLNLLLKWMTQI